MTVGPSSSSDSSSTTRPRPGRLVLLCVAQFMVALDFSVANLALASISDEFTSGQGQLQWVITGYVITFGGFLLLCGKATDVYGARRVLVLGLLGFSVACVAGAFAGSLEVLVIARMAQGMAAAMITPAALSLLLLLFAREPIRSRALSLYGAAPSMGFVIGLIVGGVLTDAWGWRAVMWVNVPLAVVAAGLAVRWMPSPVGVTGSRRLDAPGGILVTGASLSIAFGLSAAGEHGPGSPPAIGALLGGIAAVGLLILVERPRRDPLLPLRIFKVRGLSAAAIGAIATVGPAAGCFFVITLYLQQTRAYSASETAVAFIPFGAASLAGCAVAPRMLARRGARTVLCWGLGLQACGALVLTLILVAAFVPVLFGTVAFGVGNALALVGFMALGTGAVDAADRGLASGVLGAGQELGAGLGLAALVFCAAVFAGDAGYSGTAWRSDEMVAGYASAFVAAAMFSALGASTALLMTRERGSASGRLPKPKSHDAEGEELAA
jgi:MFS family permease